jgi:hypothetical protein
MEVMCCSNANLEDKDYWPISTMFGFKGVLFQNQVSAGFDHAQVISSPIRVECFCCIYCLGKVRPVGRMIITWPGSIFS